MAKEQITVSPGVYTSEVDLTTVSSSIGVTTLGLVGETLKGPAFEPIFINSPESFAVRFGGQSPELFNNNVPKYELPYIANEYLKESNQLYVTRVLGLTGYNAGNAWLLKVSSSDTANTNNMVVGVIRSKGFYDSDLLKFQASAVTISNVNSANTMASFSLLVNGDETIVSLDQKAQNYLPRVIGKSNTEKVGSKVYVDEIHGNLIADLYKKGLISGFSLESAAGLNNYVSRFKTPETPYIVSELRGNMVEQLFKFISISDGDSANSEIKISFQNINLATKEFDVIIRDFNDTDDNVIVLESFTRCSMNKNLNNYIGKKIGTGDNLYPLRSSFVYLEINKQASSDGVPAGFEGYVSKPYGSNKITKALYKTSYDIVADKVKKTYLGISNVVGIDADRFKYIGEAISTATTKGFHLDSGATILNRFEVGKHQFRNEVDLINTDYEKVNSRKFTVAPAGGFDGWDIYRAVRTNTDDYRRGVPKFSAFTETNPSDYYAFLDGINTFNNPSEIDINLFATPGIDYERNNGLVRETIDMIEDDRADTLYIVTTPEQGTGSDAIESMVDVLDTADIDSSYTATYGPWILHNDVQNGVNLYLPPTAEVMRVAAFTDNTQAPWFAPAGVTRGLLNTKKVKNKLTDELAGELYKGRINPVRTFSGSAVLFGQKTLQVKESALDRINVRRLLLQVRKLVSAVAIRLVFEPNDTTLQNQFKRLVEPILQTVKQQRGVTEFKVICDSTNNTPESIERLELNGVVLIKPTRSAEYIKVKFALTPEGASFENI